MLNTSKLLDTIEKTRSVEEKDKRSSLLNFFKRQGIHLSPAKQQQYVNG